MVKSKSKYSLKIGDKVKGVEFSNADYPRPGWCDTMSDYVGKVGEVWREMTGFEGFSVRFDDGMAWSYPAHLLKKVEDNGTNKQPAKKESTPKSATAKSVWVVVDTETGNVIAIETTREKARQMKARLNGEFKIAKMVFDKWVR